MKKKIQLLLPASIILTVIVAAVVVVVRANTNTTSTQLLRASSPNVGVVVPSTQQSTLAPFKRFVSIGPSFSTSPSVIPSATSFPNQSNTTSTQLLRASSPNVGVVVPSTQQSTLAPFKRFVSIGPSFSTSPSVIPSATSFPNQSNTTSTQLLRASSPNVGVVVPSTQQSTLAPFKRFVSIGPSFSTSPSIIPSASSSPNQSNTTSTQLLRASSPNVGVVVPSTQQSTLAPFKRFVSIGPSFSTSPSVIPSPTSSPNQSSKPSVKALAPIKQSSIARIASASPSKRPAFTPLSVSSLSPTYTPIDYSYRLSETSICSIDGTSNWQGPLPVSSNTVLQFFAFGDSPYDANANTCIGKDGLPQKPCKRYDCTKNKVESGNTCTYEGPEYQCVKESIIPYINRKIASGGAAFALHVGDIIKGGGGGGSGKCSEASFESRKALFSQCSNFLLVPGDNEWNECPGHITSNNDAMSMLWRAKFASEQSPFHNFSDDFPSAVGGGRPDVIRHSENPEILFFIYNGIAFFGLNLPAGLNYIEKKSLVDKNAKWIEDNLDKDRCNLKSIVLFGHTDDTSRTYNEKLQSYYDACSTIPTLVIVGNSHPTNYCMKKNSEYRLTLTTEAFQSGPLLVSVVHDADGNHYFHILDKDMLNSNGVCPDLSHSD